MSRGSRLMCVLLLLGLPWMGRVRAEPVTVRTPEEKLWVGQRVPFYVEVRAPGSFAGTVQFDAPPLPGVLLMKIGNPVVGSEERDGRSWFVQTHEFALFTQKAGTLEVPPVPVRYAYRDGFTGPEQETTAEVPGWSVQIQRPPRSEPVGFLITTESLDVTETWDPPPGPVEAGAVFKRTIVQQATQVSGMALAPAPTQASEGIRVYLGDAETRDRVARGDFIGERSETITYLMQQPGTLTLPALRYVWWNPVSEVLESKELPAVTFQVTPSATAAAPGSSIPDRTRWVGGVLGAVLLGLAIWRRRQLAAGWRRGWRLLRPPERVAARRLLRACRRNDAVDAEAAWNAWRTWQGPRFLPGPALQAAIVNLLRVRYGPASTERWNGATLAEAFRSGRAASKQAASREASPHLPLLNSQP